MTGLVTIAVVVFLAGMVLDRVLPALVVYAVLSTVSIGLELYLRFASDVPLADERERELHRLASHVTIWLFGYLGFFALLALYALDVTGARELGTAGETLLYAFAVVYLSWGGIYLGLKYLR